MLFCIAKRDSNGASPDTILMDISKVLL
ncbi:unnamed protein product [Acanthoscelides obtectus]|uniref:Uncharacterized protein n=1 Tax=Acanthoscelides obtectus TaxID=200917 RepID=A0A9P0KC51_ACAOB|nr:unnamed protein product [Acanthoscelides obtectus]CAK1655373.1 hypothetical protein AOBTE_LOCUS19158 [Acanthoscelides obtectus]